MWPVVTRIGSFEISSFGVMVAAGVLAALWLFGRELAARGLPQEVSEVALLAVIGGMLGAKLLWVVEHRGEDTFLGLLVSRGGLSWFGGLAGGISTGLARLSAGQWPVVPVLAAATPALALGHAIGRIGCFLVGDDYGRPTDLPWGVAFPKGMPPTSVPVHPTQLYEALPLALLAGLLVASRRRDASDRSLIATYLLATGAARFAIEVLRVNARVALGMSVAQFASLAVFAAGVASLIWSRAGALAQDSAPA